MTLELSAMRWLWLEQKCLVVLQERSPFYAMGQPDVLGVTKGRYLTEIEVKRSLSDFRADFKKTHRVNRSHHLPSHPRQFYYLVPPELVERVKPLLPDWAGLMTTEGYHQVKVLVVAPVNKESKQLGPVACARLSRMMTSHMMGYANSCNTWREQIRNHDSTGYIDWIEAEVGTYSI
jgi:hypothetical protein